MRVLRVIPVLFVGLVLGCAGMQQAGPPVVDTAAVTAAADSVQGAWSAAYAARDTNALLGLYADDAKVLAPGMATASTPEAIRAGFVGFMSIPNGAMTLSSTSKIISQSGDMVADVGTYSMTFSDARGNQVTDVGKYLTVMRKTDSGWKIVADTWNSDAPGPM